MQCQQERISCEFPPEEDLWKEMHKGWKTDGTVINRRRQGPRWGPWSEQSCEGGSVENNEESGSGGAETKTERKEEQRPRCGPTRRGSGLPVCQGSCSLSGAFLCVKYSPKSRGEGRALLTRDVNSAGPGAGRNTTEGLRAGLRLGCLL